MRHLKDVDLNLLRVFQTIMEARSLTLAAGRLGITQPAVSYALNRLRKLFDDALFVRTPEGMLPTQTAVRIALPIGRALTAVRDALNETEPFDPGTSDREFRLCMSDIGEQVFLPALCKRLQTLAPRITLSSELVPIAMVVERMRTGQLDFAIGNLSTLKPTTRYKSLFHEQYACMTRKRDRLPTGTISVEQFLAFPHVSVTSTDSSHVGIEDTLVARGLNRHIALRVPHFTVVPQILSHTGWMVILPKGVAHDLNHSEDFAIYPLPVEIPGFESTLHWHGDYNADAGNRWLREFIFDTLRR
ncbi:DNA-binding transcriptional regulator, LysR family [Pseudomonas sp. URIL14HWK12:I8]|uniref:LysR family transcriptional regulator n=1 Tax=unclassified Pseudomonas TaxID=196821 RepID=UPI000482F122|nr:MULTISPECIES: LysR family transcriptional regulator [unclassified Pseudomonas]SNB80176.1 DNA-binding transcriptional regulator, LysR family [Pseudomonas sp. URIL14HWK12:I8]